MRSSKDSEDSEERCSVQAPCPAHATLQWPTTAYTRSVCCPPDQPGPLRTDLAGSANVRTCQRAAQKSGTSVYNNDTLVSGSVIQ